jgi:hypothetical protein
MGNTASTVYSDPQFDPGARAKLSPGDYRAATSYHTMLRADPPGMSWDDRLRQVQHFKSVPYIAIRAVMDLVGGASYQLLRRNRKPKGKTTFAGNGTVAKSSSHGQQQGRDEDYTPFDDYDHPLSCLVRKPNPNESMGEFVAKVVLQNRLTGVGPVWALGSKASPEKPVRLWSLRTPFLFPVPGFSEQFPNGAWRVNPYKASSWAGSMPMQLGSAGAVLPAEEVKRFVDPHPWIDWDGWSPLAAGALQLDTYDAIEASRKATMDNGLGIDTIITIPGADTHQVNRTKGDVEGRHMGPQNHGKTLVIGTPQTGNDKTSVTTLTPRSSKDLDHQNGWEQTVKFILALFGVPDSIAGLKSAGSYAESYAARQQFYDRQEDYLHRLAVWFDREFLDPWESYPDEFTLRIKPKPIQDKEHAETVHSRQCQNGTIMYNESRAKDDLPPVPGGDIPVPVYIQQQTQKFAANRREPQLPSGAPDLDKQDEMNKLVADKGTGGDAPRPGNPQAAGSLPPRPEVKAAMSSLSLADGGALVPPTMPRRKKGARRRRLDGVLRKALEGLTNGGK